MIQSLLRLCKKSVFPLLLARSSQDRLGLRWCEFRIICEKTGENIWLRDVLMLVEEIVP